MKTHAPLRDADLSNVPDDKLTPAQQRELKRRLCAFTEAVATTGPAPAPSKPRVVRKWTPGAPAPK